MATPSSRPRPTGPAPAGARTASPAPRSTATRRLLSREERQASILRAAATAFARAGFAATSMEDVAAEAGITKLIVYRHFDSKEDLYKAVLAGVSDRLREEFLAGLHQRAVERSGFTVRSILTVARENPDGFRLLTVHAAREPQFTAALVEFRDRGVALADGLLADMIPDPVVKAWATRTIVDYLVQGVNAWLDVGDAGRDDEFVALATSGLRGMVLPWVDEGRLPDHLRSARGEVRGPTSF